MSDVKNVLLDDLNSTLPKISLTLPTMGLFNEKTTFDPNSNVEELSIHPFSIWEEVHYRNPYDIMSGKAFRSLLRTVAPEILNPDEINTYDMDAIQLAGRMASYGTEMELESVCSNTKDLPHLNGSVVTEPKDGEKYEMKRCDHKNKMKVDLKSVIQSLPILTEEDVIKWRIKLPNNQLVQLRPMLYKDAMEVMKIAVNQQRLMTAMGNMENVSEEQQMEVANASMNNEVLVRLIKLKSCIWYVTTSDGSNTIKDKDFISDWLDKVPYKAQIQKKLDELSSEYEQKTYISYDCPNCGHHNARVGLMQDHNSFFTGS